MGFQGLAGSVSEPVELKKRETRTALSVDPAILSSPSAAPGRCESKLSHGRDESRLLARRRSTPLWHADQRATGRTHPRWTSRIQTMSENRMAHRPQDRANDGVFVRRPAGISI